MSLAILCILLCLVSPTVIAVPPWDNAPYGPRRIPWPGQQCIDAKLGYVGVCMGARNICRNLVCAYRDGRGGYISGRYRPARPGTVCAPFKVCHRGQCVHGDITNMPRQSGFPAIYDCRYHYDRRK